MESVELSFIVPVYNVERYLKRCVDSLADQGLPPSSYEIIIVNDGSTDNSREIAVELQKQYDSVRIIDRPNGGLSAARNTGLDHVRGKYVMFVDSDDYVESCFVGRIIDLMEEYSLELCFFYSVSRYADGTFSLIDQQRLELFRIYSGIEAIKGGLKITSVWHNLYSRDFLQQTGVRFHEGIVHEDIPFNHILYPQCERMMFTDVLGYNYCHDGESITRSRDIGKIQKRYIGNLMAVHDIFSFWKDKNLDRQVWDLFRKRLNSLLAAQLYYLSADVDRTGYRFACEYLRTSESLGLYPICGNTTSKRNDRSLTVLNRKWCYLTFARLTTLWHKL